MPCTTRSRKAAARTAKTGIWNAEEHLPNKAVKLIAWQLGNLGNAIWPALEFDTTHIRHTPDTMVELPGSIVQPLQPF